MDYDSDESASSGYDSDESESEDEESESGPITPPHFDRLIFTPSGRDVSLKKFEQERTPSLGDIERYILGYFADQKGPLRLYVSMRDVGSLAAMKFVIGVFIARSQLEAIVAANYDDMEVNYEDALGEYWMQIEDEDMPRRVPTPKRSPNAFSISSATATPPRSIKWSDYRTSCMQLAPRHWAASQRCVIRHV